MNTTLRQAGDQAAGEMIATMRALLARLQDDPADRDGHASNILCDAWGSACPELGPAISQTEGAPDSIARALGSVVWGEALCPPTHPTIGSTALCALELSAPLLLAHQKGGPLAAAVEELYMLAATVAIEALGRDQG